MTNSNHPIMRKLNSIMAKLESLLKNQEIKNGLSAKYTPISNKEFMQLFNISSGTASSWREKELIPFIHIDKKIYYKLNDIKIFIDQHYIKKKE